MSDFQANIEVPVIMDKITRELRQAATALQDRLLEHDAPAMDDPSLAPLKARLMQAAAPRIEQMATTDIPQELWPITRRILCETIELGLAGDLDAAIAQVKLASAIFATIAEHMEAKINEVTFRDEQADYVSRLLKRVAH